MRNINKLRALTTFAIIGILVAMLLLLTNFTAPSTVNNMTVDGAVVIVANDLIVETDSPNPTISWVLIDYASTGLQAAFYTGCGCDYCVYDISSLKSETCNVTVQTSTGRFFKGVVVVP